MNNRYLIEADSHRGRLLVEIDRSIGSRAKVIDLIRSGEVRPVRIIEICEDGKWQDVTDDINAEVAEVEAEYAQASKAARELFQLDHARDYRKNGE